MLGGSSATECANFGIAIAEVHNSRSTRPWQTALAGIDFVCHPLLGGLLFYITRVLFVRVYLLCNLSASTLLLDIVDFVKMLLYTMCKPIVR